MILEEILAEEIHETPGKTLAGEDRDAAARPLPGRGKTLAEDTYGTAARPASAQQPANVEL